MLVLSDFTLNDVSNIRNYMFSLNLPLFLNPNIAWRNISPINIVYTISIYDTNMESKYIIDKFIRNNLAFFAIHYTDTNSHTKFNNIYYNSEVTYTYEICNINTYMDKFAYIAKVYDSSIKYEINIKVILVDFKEIIFLSTLNDIHQIPLIFKDYDFGENVFLRENRKNKKRTIDEINIDEPNIEEKYFQNKLIDELNKEFNKKLKL